MISCHDYDHNASHNGKFFKFFERSKAFTSVRIPWKSWRNRSSLLHACLWMNFMNVYFFVFQVLILLQKLSLYSATSALFYVLLCTTLTALLNPLIYAFFSRSYSAGYRQLGAKAWQIITGCPLKPNGFTGKFY